ncbi:MarR family winged helix-turn-helix transcriptional regulator [Pacificoceanicola onchidii]|uniref:MarR family winged helix-turn-helix transcriptional regulator n=1 Tax=Pacificoceanicola onchidii TaxID=2562685 RepID=UPI001F10F6B3|nr:MarR family winged helix-turn-helix transcriptional regulator [Pacificoceanicola onchidii]
MYSVNMKAEHLHRLVWMSRPLMQAAEACVEAGLAGTGLTVRMRAVLEILHQSGEQTVPEIAARLEIKRQYVQVMCNETLASGFVEQRPNPRHKRSPFLALTDQGRSLIEQIISKELALMAELGADLDSQDIARALDVVCAVTDRLRKQGSPEE